MARTIKYCSFCGRPLDYKIKFVTGPGVAICKTCLDTCNEIINNAYTDGEENADTLPVDIPTPEEIKSYLDDYVIGQDEAKRTLSVAVYNHYKRIKYAGDLEKEGIEIDKSNILMIGPTGTGKTLIARTLAKKLDVPFAISDATTLTEAGYVGEDVENILLRLIENANYDVKKAERGIVFVDEIDKIARKGENVSITRDVSGEGVQQALLKIIEGTVASVPPQGGRKHPNQEMIKIDTSNILFICGGAFVGLDKIIENRVSVAHIGFGSPIEDEKKDYQALYKNLHPDDLIKFGLIPEFVGRLPIHTSLNDLRKEDLKKILTEPKNSIIKQYEASFKLDGIDLVFEDDALNAIAEVSFEQKTGARGLRSIVENIMLGVSYDTPSLPDVRKIIVRRENVVEGTDPIIIRDSDERKAISNG